MDKIIRINLTSEQVDMLMEDLSNVESVALFLMNDDDKYTFFSKKFHQFSDLYNKFSSDVEKYHAEFLNFQAAGNPDFEKFMDLQHRAFEHMMRCSNYKKIYELLLDTI